MKELKELCRANIWNLSPYSCARTEFSGKKAHNFLDANENPYNDPYNRYPDPFQTDVKKVLSKIKDVPVENIFWETEVMRLLTWCIVSSVIRE